MLYICSFSETHESISQWQRYGGDGYGYCIGFNTSKLQFKLRIGDRHVTLMRMLYNMPEQTSAVLGCVKEVSDIEQSDSEWSNVAEWELMGSLDGVMLQLKNPRFEDEREWRLAVRLDVSEVAEWLKFVARGAYVKPYVEVAMVKSNDEFEPLPIDMVVCGPKLDKSLAVQATRQLLTAAKLSSVAVKHSKLAASWR